MEAVNIQLFGNDPKVTKAVSIAKNVSVTKAPVLISGEVGIGKKTLGHFIHQNSKRCNGPVEIVDCSMDPQKVEDQILGYRDDTGKFNKGVLELANGGSVIMANIDGVEENFQKRLHTVLTELDDYDIDVRIITTTTKNLSKLVGSGRFYRGLYVYLSVNNITLPPLRERTSDLEMLAKYFIANYNSETELVFDSNAINKILSHYWTHNVHELKAVIENSIENSENGILNEKDLAIGEKRAVSIINDDDNEGIRLMSLKDAEKLLIKKALIHTSENRTQAAKILGVSIRTLRNKINEYRNGGNSYFVNLR